MFYGNSGASAASSFNCVFPNVLSVTGAVTLGGNQNYDWIDIQAGSTVTVASGQVLSFKGRRIIMDGTINGNNRGYGAASGPGAGCNGGGGQGGSGGGYGGNGGTGGGCAGGPAYGTANGNDIDMGSGGGGSDCNPTGGGGGAVKLEAAVIDLNGSISVNGQTTGGSCTEEAAGGGSGGGILIQGDYVNGTGSLDALGGNGQNSQDKEGGGGGAGGRIKIFYCKENNFAGAASVNGGQPGSGPQPGETAGNNGTSTVNTYACESVTVGAEQYSVVANAGNDVAYCSGSTVTIGTTAIAGYTYSWSPSAGLSNDTVSGPTLIITNNGSANLVTNYIVSATSNGCTVTDTVQVTVYPLPTSDFTAVGPVCVDEGLIISYTGNADTSLATFVWDFDSAVVSVISGQVYQVSWDTSGTKNITLTVVQNGCLSSQQQVIVTVNPPNASAGPDVSFCSGGTETVGTSSLPGYTYSWSPPAGLSDSAISNPSVSLSNLTSIPLIYDYVVTTFFAGCSHTDTVSITVNPEPVSDAGPDITNLCSGNSALIGAANNPDYAYSWLPVTGLSSAAVSSPTVMLSNTNASPYVGTYIVTTTFAAYGCTTSDTVNVTVYQIPTAVFSAPDSVCINEDATIIYTGNATGNASYQWDFAGGNALPGAGQGPHTVSWTSSGTVTVTLNVTEICSSATPGSFDIFIKPFPVVDAGADTAYCSGNTVVIGGFPSSGYTYSWSPSSGLSSDNISNPAVNLTNTSPTPLVNDYIVTATLNNCISVDTVEVTVYQVPTSPFILPSQVCGTDGAVITYSGNAAAGATYTWGFDGGTIVSGSGQGPYMISWPVTGQKNISLTVTENGCSSTLTVDSMNVFPLPAAIAGADATFCSGNSFVMGTSSTPGYSYSWSPPGGLNDPAVSNPTVSLITLNSIDTVEYIVTTSANNCVSKDTAQIIVYPEPVAGFSSPDNAQCLENNSFDFTAAGTFLPEADFYWNFSSVATPPASTLQNPSGIVFGISGTYSVSLTIDQYGCSGTAYDSVIVYPMPSASFAPNDSDGCEPFTVKFYSQPDMSVSYLWNFGDFQSSTVSNPPHTYLSQGTYNVSLTITTANACSTQYNAGDIYVYPKPEANFVYAPEEITNLHPVASFTDHSSLTALAWSWDFGDGTTSADKNPMHTFPDTGTYIISLIIENNYGCSDTVLDTLTVFPDYNFFVPNAFSPNSDGWNDFFIPEAIGIDVSEFEMLIFDRWGELIFVTQSPDNPWDGSLNGKPVKEDAYVWIVNLRDVFRKPHSYMGSVTVVR